MASVERSIVGELINFRGMVYAPLNEMGVVFLFGKVAEDLNMYAEEIRPEFPDTIVRRFTGKGWERLRVEFEYRASDFRQRGENGDSCDLIVCWENDWTDSTIEVLELRDRIREMENHPIRRPDEAADGEPGSDLEAWFDRHAMQDRPRALFQALAETVKAVDDSCFYRVGQSVITFFSPERTFIHVYPRRNALRLALFTGGESLGDVQQFGGRHTGRKWGGVTIADQDALDEVLPWIEESYRRINGATERNEPTGWHAVSEEVAEEEEVYAEE